MVTTEDLSKKIDIILSQLAELKRPSPTRISFSDFCKDYGITRPTGYAWAERGLIKLEKIGGRNFVPIDSISINSRKYQRTEIP